MEVPVVLTGHAEGVKAGGKLSLEMRKLKVRAPYTEIPEKLFIDVTELGLGKTIQVGALSFEGLEVIKLRTLSSAPLSSPVLHVVLWLRGNK